MDINVVYSSGLCIPEGIGRHILHQCALLRWRLLGNVGRISQVCNGCYLCTLDGLTLTYMSHYSRTQTRAKMFLVVSQTTHQ